MRVVVAMFDLPTDTKQSRREYALFRKHLLKNGFQMMQYSVTSDTVRGAKTQRSTFTGSGRIHPRTAKFAC